MKRRFYKFLTWGCNTPVGQPGWLIFANSVRRSSSFFGSI
jgi:hypothetical protein